MALQDLIAPTTWLAARTKINANFADLATLQLVGLGNFSHSVTIGAGVTPSAIPHNANDALTGVLSHSESVNNTRFSASEGDVWVRVDAIPQVEKTGSGNEVLKVFFRIDGTTVVSNSAIADRGKSSGDTTTGTAVGIFFLSAGSYFEVMHAASAASEFDLLAEAGSGAGATEIPAVPSIITTVSMYKG